MAYSWLFFLTIEMESEGSESFEEEEFEDPIYHFKPVVKIIMVWEWA